ncbi:MAG: 16S rRNA (uracil(1498)-N(3))-methyltransferase [Planctomycetes bacterium]|nr:16S rRNA (uracil(1498)-N(3))-methyltransferase [Planctomycetota bacterium]
MARRYFADPLPAIGPATLSARHGHHLGRIVNTGPGDAVVLFDGAGLEVHATVLAVGAREVQVMVVGPVAVPLGRRPRLALDVACALPRKRADWLFEHGTEVGIRSFWPIVTERTNRQHEQPEHWRRILIAASAVRPRAVPPTMRPTSASTGCARWRCRRACFVATMADTERRATTAAEALLVVGPRRAHRQGIPAVDRRRSSPRNLGPWALRTGTPCSRRGGLRLLQALPTGRDRSRRQGRSIGQLCGRVRPRSPRPATSRAKQHPGCSVPVLGAGFWRSVRRGAVVAADPPGCGGPTGRAACPGPRAGQPGAREASARCHRGHRRADRGLHRGPQQQLERRRLRRGDRQLRGRHLGALPDRHREPAAGGLRGPRRLVRAAPHRLRRRPPHRPRPAARALQRPQRIRLSRTAQAVRQARWQRPGRLHGPGARRQQPQVVTTQLADPR